MGFDSAFKKRMAIAGSGAAAGSSAAAGSGLSLGGSGLGLSASTGAGTTLYGGTAAGGLGLSASGTAAGGATTSLATTGLGSSGMSQGFGLDLSNLPTPSGGSQQRRPTTWAEIEELPDADIPTYQSSEYHPLTEAAITRPEEFLKT